MVVDIETALFEVHSWLDYKKVKPEIRSEKEKEKQISELAGLVSDGTLVINSETNEITHKLLFPVGKDIETTTLVYKPRLNVGAVQRAMSGVKSDDLHGMIVAYGSAATGQTKNLIQALDTQDYKALQSIVVFFM